MRAAVRDALSLVKNPWTAWLAAVHERSACDYRAEGIPGGGRLSAMWGLSCIDNVVLCHSETRDEARDYAAYETMSVNAIVFGICPEG
jgi:hypothetical protein